MNDNHWELLPGRLKAKSEQLLVLRYSSIGTVRPRIDNAKVIQVSGDRAVHQPDASCPYCGDTGSDIPRHVRLTHPNLAAPLKGARGKMFFPVLESKWYTKECWDDFHVTEDELAQSDEEEEDWSCLLRQSDEEPWTDENPAVAHHPEEEVDYFQTKTKAPRGDGTSKEKAAYLSFMTAEGKEWTPIGNPHVRTWGLVAALLTSNSGLSRLQTEQR